MQTHNEQQSTSALSPSQQFILELGYEGSVSAADALRWHYEALKRRNAFKRHQEGTETMSSDPEVVVPFKEDDHMKIISEMGVDPLSLAGVNLSSRLPEEVDTLLWIWVL